MKVVDKEDGANIILIPEQGIKKYWHRDDELPLEEAYELSGIDHGYIQLLEVELNGKKAQMLIHEEGKIRGLLFNEEASHIFWESQAASESIIPLSVFDFIVGPVLILLDEAKWT